LFTAESISSPKESESETKYPNRTGNLERERERERELTGEEEELTVRREISSTLGRKTAIWELAVERWSLESQGDSWSVLLYRNEFFAANAIPKVNPSDRATVVSKHGEYTLLLSLALTESTAIAAARIAAIVVNDIVGVLRRTAMANRECFW
jgi:hypothetical protein